MDFTLLAINADTGKVLLSNSGSMTEDAFYKTVLASFPGLARDKILFFVDGEMTGATKKNAGKGPAVIWRGSFTDLGGYANMNREIALRLLKRGFAVKLDILRTAPQVDRETMRMLNVLASTRLRNSLNCPMVVGFTPMPIQSRGRKVVFFTMMETQGIHKAFVDTCNRYPSEIWVPCKFYVDAFKKAGIAKPLHLMPLGVNEGIYVPDAKEPVLDYEEMPSGRIVGPPDKFRFMSLFGWSYRKGPDVLCRSFLREFDADDDACLVIYSRYQGGSEMSQKEYIRNEIRSYYKEIGKDNPPPIYYHGGEIPISDLPGCYAAADCFVFCSRGEGFGLPVIEAGACGLPVISTYNSAMTQYLDDGVACLVQTDEYAPANDKMTWITEFYRDQSFPVLGEKAVAEFSRLMRQVYENPDGARKMASNFRNRILSEYTWDICADRVAERLGSMAWRI